MTKSFHASFFLLTILLFLGSAKVPAQQPVMLPPPIPSVLPPPPPDTEALPAPPQLEWAPLVPKDQEGQAAAAPAEEVPPPKAEASVTPPPPPVVETPLLARPGATEIQIAKPEVEVWRLESELPQVPARTFNRLDQAYGTGTEPVWLRAQFDARAAGKSVSVRPGRGITLNPPVAVLTVSPNGECLVLAQLAEGVVRSHIIFYCAGMRTVLPVVRASLATVISAEAETGGGR